jgi:Zn-dependent alcohol dehydrogenase
MLSILPVSVALNHEIETILGDEIGETDFTSAYNESKWIEQLAPGGADKIIEMVGSIIAVTEANPENLNEMKTALISLNENVSQLNSGVESPEVVLELDNSTYGESYGTVPVSEDMSRILEMMAEVIN